MDTTHVRCFYSPNSSYPMSKSYNQMQMSMQMLRVYRNKYTLQVIPLTKHSMQAPVSQFQNTDIPAHDQQIKKLLVSIQNLTVQMNNTFEQAILKHEEQFIKTYRIKISELTSLFEDLTRVLEDKFINNALTNRLNIVLKERDYFKYECLKLNIQYQTVIGEQSSLAGQIANVTDQMKIYKHLLEDQKIKNKELEKNAQKYKSNFSEMAYKTLTQNMDKINSISKPVTTDLIELEKKNKKLQMVLHENKQKNEIIRNLKLKMSELELVVNERQAKYIERKQLYETFKACVDSWKRDVITKERKQLSASSNYEKKAVWNVQKLSTATKKDLLRYFFTSSQFLKFVEQLLFDPNFSVEFNEVSIRAQKYIGQNRVKLFEYMRRKKLLCTPQLLER